MKLIHHLAAVALAVVAVVITVLIWNWRESTPSTTTNASGSATASVTTTTATTRAPTPAKASVRVMTREDRERLREQIQAAIAKRTAASKASAASSGSSPQPALEELPELKLEEVGPGVQTALKEAIPHLVDCYNTDEGGSNAGGKRAAALMRMISDPELGMVIDTERVTDKEGAPLAEGLENCMRDAIESLALPGLDKPGALVVQYTFVFD